MNHESRIEKDLKQNKKSSPTKEVEDRPNHKAQFIWIVLGIAAILLIWLLSYLLYR